MYSFLDNNIVKFFQIFLHVNRSRINIKECYEVFKELRADISFPLFIIYGIIEPINVEEWRQVRDWGFWLLKFDVLNEELDKFVFPQKYEYDKELRVKTSVEDDEWFKRAKFKIKKLTDIKNQEDLKNIADELVKMSF